MATTIITKNGSGAPVAGDLVQGELAVDLTNKEVYTKDSNGAVIKIGSAGDGSGIPEAPEDGKQYAREDAGWSEVVIPSTAWDDITSKPTEFPPSAHVHTIANVTGLSDALDGKSDVGHKHVIADVTGLQDALDNAGGVDYTLPVVLRSGDAQLPLTVDGTKLAVMTRGGELELPLAA